MYNSTTVPDGFKCTFETCTIESSSFDYRPSLAMNGLLLAIFGLSLVLNIIQGVAFKTWGFLIAMFFGNLAEIIGYAGRVWAYSDPWADDSVSGINNPSLVDYH